MFSKLGQWLKKPTRATGTISKLDMETDSIDATMPDTAFWYIIQRSKQHSMDSTFLALWSWLQDCDDEQVLAFAKCYLKKKIQLASVRSWVAASLINGEMTEDRYGAFLNWVISLGSSHYDLMLNDPDEIADFLSLETYAYAHFQDHSVAASGVWNEKHGKRTTEPASGFPRVNDPSEFIRFSPPGQELWHEVASTLPKLSGFFERAKHRESNVTNSDSKSTKRILN